MHFSLAIEERSVPPLAIGISPSTVTCPRYLGTNPPTTFSLYAALARRKGCASSTITEAFGIGEVCAALVVLSSLRWQLMLWLGGVFIGVFNSVFGNIKQDPATPFLRILRERLFT